VNIAKVGRGAALRRPLYRASFAYFLGEMSLDGPSNALWALGGATGHLEFFLRVHPCKRALALPGVLESVKGGFGKMDLSRGHLTFPCRRTICSRNVAARLQGAALYIRPL